MNGFSGQKISVSDYLQVYDPRFPTLGRILYGEAIVGPGVEFPNLADLVTYIPPGTSPIQGISLDVQNNSITEIFPISSEGKATPSITEYSVILLQSPYAPRISDVKLLATNDPNMDAGSISFTHNSIVSTSVGGGVRPSDQPLFYKLGVQFEHSVDVQANSDGTHTITGLDNNQQINSVWFDTLTGGGVHEAFVFKPHFGQDEITDFIVGGRQHDVVSLSSSEFGTLAQVLSKTHDVNGNAVIHVTAHDTITIDGVTKADLIAHPHDVIFHP